MKVDKYNSSAISSIALRCISLRQNALQNNHNRRRKHMSPPPIVVIFVWLNCYENSGVDFLKVYVIIIK